MMVIGIAAMTFLALMLVIVGIASPRAADEVEARLVEYGGRPMTLEEIELAQPFSQRVMVPLVNASARFVSRFTPQQSLEAARHKLDLAGNPNNWTATQFMGIRGLAAVLLTGLTFILTMVTGTELAQRLLFIVGMGFLGFLLPGMWLGSKIRKRQENIVKGLPDALDLLTVCVEAGLGINSAFLRIAEEFRLSSPTLSEEFDVVNREMVAGKPRMEALRALADRTGVEDVKSRVAMLIHTERLGTSLAQSLRVHSDSLRVRRRQRAEEAAAKTTIKLVFPLVFLLFPALFIVILGPGVLQILHVLFPSINAATGG